MLTVAYDESTLRKNVYKWYKLKAERMSITKLGLHAPARQRQQLVQRNVEEIKTFVSANRRVAIREVADEVCILFNSCQAIFTILGMRRVWAEFVSKLFNLE